ncbi:hypothetical protein CEXT_129091 [Caerostris extrusa]|uniref:Uncharacterized protein n=1 Tax=Caerostris extrusa TaxID=172846 RepID=A0AAV4XVR6_CAEEX|nr:hypothetical protein CEXT_129091 [Caerostris extrusa]
MKPLLRLHQIETDEGSDIGNEDYVSDNVLEDNFSDYERFTEHDMELKKLVLLERLMIDFGKEKHRIPFIKKMVCRGEE